jgi:hypothetical protein
MKGTERLKQQTAREKAGRRARKWPWQTVYARPRRQSRPAFVVGSGRCGSTMLAEQLWECWAVSRFDGNHPAAYERWKLRDLDTIESVVRASWAPVTLFKPMLDAYRTRSFLERFSDARVVFAVRTLDDVIRSSLRRFGPANRIGHVRAWIREDFAEFSSVPPPVETREAVRRHWSDDLGPEAGVALYWLFYNRLFYDLELDREPRVRVVQYERVIENPRSEMKGLSEFLGIPFEENMVRGIRTDSLGAGLAYALPHALRRECDSLAARLWEATQHASHDARCAAPPREEGRLRLE